ncbi:MAG: hypothetical protein A2Z34_07150 [Planctomycetes bacterium RBG_16_59_8]|nr:MAG: hypothetical protein A2Z34_07150 [Planctomycetes bacterium RBG_16_59_8]
MKVKYLLDEQISPGVAEILARSGIDTIAVARSPYAGFDDRSLLSAAVAEGRLLVTYNIDDFTQLFGDCLKEGRPMAGIVFVDVRTIPTSDIRGLAGSLRTLAEKVARGETNPSYGVFLTKKT